MLSISGRRRGEMSTHVPNRSFRNSNHIVMLDQRYLPNPPEAVRLYEQETGGRISEESGFGLDPIGTDANKCLIRKQAFFDRYPSFEDIFNNFINSNSVMFRSALLYYIDMTYRLSRS